MSWMPKEQWQRMQADKDERVANKNGDAKKALPVPMPWHPARPVTEELIQVYEDAIFTDDPMSQQGVLAKAGFSWEEIDAINATPGMEQRILQKCRLRMLMPASPRVIRRIVKLCEDPVGSVSSRAHDMYLRLVADTSPLKSKLEEKFDDLSDPATLSRAKQLVANLSKAIEKAERKK